MRVLIDVTHPAHVHFFRHAIGELHARGHEVTVTSRHKDDTVPLLKELGIEHTVLSRVGKGLPGLLGELAVRDWRLWRFCRRFRPDVLTAIGGVFAAQVSRLLGRPAVIWDDTEHAGLSHKLTFPFAAAVYTPECYRLDLGPKQHRYPGCHELAYLHPARFTPDPGVVRQVGIDPDSPYCVVRMICWGAHHDVGQRGFSKERKVEFIERLAGRARVCITSEAPLPAELEPYRLRIPVHQIHHVLAFAKLYVGEGATMASEAAVLGTPAVYLNTLELGYIDMESQYGLVRQVTETGAALSAAVELLDDGRAGQRASEARDALLADKADVTGLIVEALERQASGESHP